MKIVNLLLVVISLCFVSCKKSKVQEVVEQNPFPQQNVKIGEDEIKVDDINAIHEKTVAFAEIYRNDIMPFLSLDFEIPLNILTPIDHSLRLRSGSEAKPGLNSSLKPPTLFHISLWIKCGAQ